MKEYRTKHAAAIAVRAALCGLPLAAAGLTAAPAFAAAGAHSISIAKSPLDQALKQLAIQTGATISYDAKALSKASSAGLSGSYSAEQALSLLLQPHPLKAVKLANGGYSIQPQAAAAGSQTQVVTLETIHTQVQKPAGSANSGAPSNAVQLPTISVTASSAQQTHVGKTAQNLKDVPQSVTVISRERMDQQGLKTLDDVMQQTTGVTREQQWLNNNYTSRGLAIKNIRYDGGGVSDIQDRNSSADMAQYEAVELLRGADGLFGAGEAGGVINLSHKRPQADTAYQAALSAGSWNNYRAELDATGALNANQTIQGRAAAVLQDQDFFYKPTHNRREMLYGEIGRAHV